MKLFSLVCAAILFAFSAQASDLQKVVFCRPNNMVSALAYIAEQQGYFRAEGLDVTFMTTTNAKICQDAAVAGRADVLPNVDGLASYTGFQEDHPLRIIAQTGVNPELALFVRRDRGITRESDLRGKMVGYLPGTFYLARVLEKQGMSFSDIHTVALQPPAMPHALQGGVIDAFVMWEPWGDQAMKVLGDKVLRLHDKTLYNFRQMFSVTKTFAQTHPDDVKALLKALLSAERYTHEHPKDAIAFLADAVKLDPVFLQKNWAEYEFKIKLDNSLVDLMKEDARFIIRDDPNFKDKSVPDYRQGIDSSFLSAVAPERVEAGF